MLVETLQKINKPLSREEFAKILYSLIQPDCGKVQPQLDVEPYSRLRPILNEQFTMTIIRNLSESQYAPAEISGILAHIYKYSIVSNNDVMASYQLQPHVSTFIDNDGKYVLYYETFNEKKVEGMRYMNDWRYIYQPIEFIEKPCVLPIDERGIETDNIFTFEQCDQNAAFRKMAEESYNQPKPSSSSSSSSSKRLPVGAVPISKTTPSRHFLSRFYLLGYYYLGSPSAKVVLSHGS